MKKLYIFFMLFVITANLQAQCADEITLSSQADVDNFATNYGCSNYSGFMTISGDDITNLYGLSGLTSMEGWGWLVIGNCPNLTSLAGLENLQLIEGDLYIDNCGITSLEGLSDGLELTSGGFLSIVGCNGLTNLEGANFNMVGDLDISYCEGLTSLSGLNVDFLGGLNIYSCSALTSIGEVNVSSIDYFAIMECPSFTNFEGLTNTNIEFGLDITETGLTSLESLANVPFSDFMEHVYITSNPFLENFNGFNLLSMENWGTLYIGNNPVLQNLDGLSGMLGNTFDIILINNDALTNVDGLSSLNSIGIMQIINNPVLENLDGLANLVTARDVYIYGNPMITSLGLTSLETMENENWDQWDIDESDGLYIHNNDALVDLNDLSNLSNFVGDLTISDNDALVDISGLTDVYEGLDSIVITDNSLLEECCVLLNLDLSNENIIIENNAVGCNSQEEILTICTAFSVQALAFHDENENGVLDAGELGVFNQNISISPDALITFTDEEGVANIYLESAGLHEVSIETSALWEVNNGITSVEVNGADGETVYFPLSPIADFGIQNLDLTSSITRCNQTTNYWLTYTNEGTVSSNGIIFIVPDELTTFITADPVPDSIANGTLFWFYEDLAPTHSAQINMQFEMPGVEAIGEEIGFYAQMDSEEEGGGDKVGLSSELICAYDPNDKLVAPIGVGEEAYTLFGDTLAYTIRFQNTGNDTAFTVVVRDTLSEFVNLNSFRPISSSHTLETQLDIETRIVEFIFNDIYLADSFVNEPASHGFIKFEIETNENLDENTLIENNAGIFFDFNPPIVTNTVSNTFVSVIPIAGFEFQCKVFLEGCYENGGYMNADLLSLIPSNQPYDTNPWYYLGQESLSEIPTTMIDWILVEARIGAPTLTGEVGTSVIETKAAILLEDGSIVGSDGGALRFTTLEEGANYYFSIRHRNHLDVLTAIPVTANNVMQYDFTTNANQAYGAEQQKGTSDGNAVLHSGDINADGIIQITDFDIWFQNKALLNNYHPADLNLDNVVQTTDFDVWFWNKAKVGLVEFQN